MWQAGCNSTFLSLHMKLLQGIDWLLICECLPLLNANSCEALFAIAIVANLKAVGLWAHRSDLSRLRNTLESIWINGSLKFLNTLALCVLCIGSATASLMVLQGCPRRSSGCPQRTLAGCDNDEELRWKHMKTSLEAIKSDNRCYKRVGPIDVENARDQSDFSLWAFHWLFGFVSKLVLSVLSSEFP